MLCTICKRNKLMSPLTMVSTRSMKKKIDQRTTVNVSGAHLCRACERGKTVCERRLIARLQWPRIISRPEGSGGRERSDESRNAVTKWRGGRRGGGTIDITTCICPWRSLALGQISGILSLKPFFGVNSRGRTRG